MGHPSGWPFFFLAVSTPPDRMNPMTSRKNQLLLVGAIFTLGLCLRLYQTLFGVPLDQVVWSDMNGYVQIADMIRKDVWQVNHFFQSIGFPFVIVFMKEFTPDWGFNLSLLNCLLSSLTLLFVWKASEDSFEFKTGAITLAIAAVHLPWIYLTTYALPESIFTFLLSVCAFLSGRIVRGEKWAIPSAFIWGVSFIAAFWLKGTHAFWGPLFLIGLFVLQKKKSLLPIIALGVPVASGLLFHAYLSLTKIGHPQLSASTSGLNFIEGKCPDKKNRDSAGYAWLSPLYYQLGLHSEKYWSVPFTNSSYFIRQGFECIKRDPFVLLQSFESIPFLFYGNTTWPLNQKTNAGKLRLYELLFTIFLICGLVFYTKSMYFEFKREQFVIWALPIIAIFLCSYIFKSEMRYRLPFDVWFIPVAVLGWSTFLKRPRPEAILE